MKSRPALAALAALLCCVVGCGSGSPVASLLAARAKVTSFELTLDERSAVFALGPALAKLEGGTIVKVKVNTDKGWTLADRKAKAFYSMREGRFAGRCVKTPIKGTGDLLSGDLPEGLQEGSPVVRSEAVDGVPCHVFELPAGGTPHTWWIGVDGLVHKVQRGDLVTTMSYGRINAVPDDEFELPAGVEVMDLGAMTEELRRQAAGAEGE